jgi:hypothetical protein
VGQFSFSDLRLNLVETIPPVACLAGETSVAFMQPKDIGSDLSFSEVESARFLGNEPLHDTGPSWSSFAQRDWTRKIFAAREEIAAWACGIERTLEILLAWKATIPVTVRAGFGRRLVEKYGLAAYLAEELVTIRAGDALMDSL